jgi:hypothetical protein
MTDIEKKNESTLVKPAAFELPEGISDFDEKDLILSNLFICQEQSRGAKDEGILVGHLFDTVTRESWDTLDVILIYQFKTRILYGEDIGDSVRCYSQDGKTPSHPTPKHHNCIECPEFMKPIEEVQATGKKYGECNITINFAAIVPGVESGSPEDFPFVISMQRTNINTAKNIMNLCLRKRQSLFAVVRNISTDEIDGKKGRFYIFRITEKDKISDADLERAKVWTNFIKQMHQSRRLSVDNDDEIKDVTPEDDDIPFG